MKRIAEQYLTEWIQQEGRKPLILRGARQVGKSTLVRLFSQSQKLNLVEINLEKKKIKSIQSEDILIEKVLAEIQSEYNVDINENSLIFFDEIQAQPGILKYFRYFYEDQPQIPIIAAGSLLEFTLEQHEFSMPVGRIEYFHLGPMTFEEFLMALNKNKLIQEIKKDKLNIDTYARDTLSELLKDYLFVGGMPAAVAEYVKSKNPTKVRAIHRSIVRTYQDDFPKYASRNNLKYIYQVFERLPDFIGKKIKYSEFLSELQSRDIRSCLQLLHRARVILICYHSNGSGVPLRSQKDDSVFKVYFLDVGLLNYLRGATWQMMQDYSEKHMIIKGEVAEQFAAQHLAYLEAGLEEPNLYYWLRDKKINNAEVDFLIEKNGEVIPVEIKAGSSGRLQSAKQFAIEKKTKLIYRYDLRKHDNTQDEMLIETKDSEKQVLKILNYHLAVIGIS